MFRLSTWYRFFLYLPSANLLASAFRFNVQDGLVHLSQFHPPMLIGEVMSRKTTAVVIVDFNVNRSESRIEPSFGRYAVRQSRIARELLIVS